MKLEPAVIDSTKQVGIVNLALTAIENAVFLIIGKWELKVLYSSLLGWLVAAFCFLLIGISVQKAVGKTPNGARLHMQKSFIGRLRIRGVFVYLMLVNPVFNRIAAILPLFFTRISISLINLKKGENKE